MPRESFHESRASRGSEILVILIPGLLFILTVIFGWFGYTKQFNDIVALVEKNKSENESKDLTVHNLGEAIHDDVVVYMLLLPLAEYYDSPDGVSTPWQLTVARILGVLTAFTAITAIVLNLLLLAWDFARLLYWSVLNKCRPYAILCGLGWKGNELAKDIVKRKKGDRLVVLDRQADNPFRDGLRKLSLVHIVKDATRETSLRYARLINARTLYILTEDDERNARIALQASDVLFEHARKKFHVRERMARPLYTKELTEAYKPPGDHASQMPAKPAYAHIGDQRMRTWLEAHCRESWLNLTCFDVFEKTAQRLFLLHPIAWREGDDLRAVRHFVVIGDNEMAQAVWHSILAMAHYVRPAKDVSRTSSQEAESDPEAIHLTLIHDRPEGKHRFEQSYPFMKVDAAEKDSASPYNKVVQYVYPWRDKVVHRQLPVDNHDLLDDEFPIYKHRGKDTMVFICLDDGVQSAALAETLEPKLYNCHDDNPSGSDKYPTYRIFRYFNYPEEESISRHMMLFKESDWKGKDDLPICAFGRYAECCSYRGIEEDVIESMAREVHLDYLENHFENYHKYIPEHLRPRFFEEHWYWCAPTDRVSSRLAALHGVIKLRMWGMEPVGGEFLKHKIIWFQQVDETYPDGMFEINEMAEMEHRRWCAEKLIDGWSYIEKDESWDKHKKEKIKQSRHHHNLTSELTDEDKDKDVKQFEGLVSFVNTVAGQKQPPSHDDPGV